MRSYAKSIALYERTKRSLAGGVSSNVRYAATPVPLFPWAAIIPATAVP